MTASSSDLPCHVADAPWAVRRLSAQGAAAESPDWLAVEEPLELRLSFTRQGQEVSQSVSITMRSPGHDEELAAGFLLTEGILQRADQIEHLGPCGPPSAAGVHQVVRVRLRPEVEVDLGRLTRHFYTSSSCGVCGKASIQALRQVSRYEPHQDQTQVRASWLRSLPARLRQAQPRFEQTGGVHGVGLFEPDAATPWLVREDVGRHNALDKLIGASWLQGRLPLRGQVLLLSGRASFELIQKAVMAGVPIVAAVGAPSSLAAQLAHEAGVTLIGFLGEQRLNLYTHPARVLDDSSAGQGLAVDQGATP